jgi:hypothetical protein
MAAILKTRGIRYAHPAAWGFWVDFGGPAIVFYEFSR